MDRLRDHLGPFPSGGGAPRHGSGRCERIEPNGRYLWQKRSLIPGGHLQFASTVKLLHNNDGTVDDVWIESEYSELQIEANLTN